MLALVALLSFLRAVTAQSNSTASTVSIEGVEANFQQAQIVPQLFSTFTPQGLLNIDFGNGSISTGTPLSQTAVASYPTLTVVPENNASSVFSSGSLYTVAMIDANAVGTDETATAQTRHWLVNGVTLSGTQAPYSVNYTGSIAITDYAGPGPASGSGAHRYIIVLYAQPSTFTAPANLSTAGTPLGTWFFPQYVSSAGLGDLVAANYFTVENGVASSSIPATTAVASSTLAGFSSTTVAAGSASGSASKSASGSASGTATSAAATASTSKSAASPVQNGGLGWGVVVGALGVVGCVVGAGIGL